MITNGRSVAFLNKQKIAFATALKGVPVTG
jgi:hypothetical protein